MDTWTRQWGAAPAAAVAPQALPQDTVPVLDGGSMEPELATVLLLQGVEDLCVWGVGCVGCVECVGILDVQTWAHDGASCPPMSTMAILDVRTF